MSFEETMVLLVFGFAAFMWVTRTFLWDDKIPGIDDTMIAIFAASLLFLIPSLNKGGRVLDWSVSKDLPWGILLLFGGGLALATGFKETGLAEWIGGRLTVLDGFNFVVIVIISTALVLFLTEITSNTATATMILPVLASLALALNVHPYALMVPLCNGGKLRLHLAGRHAAECNYFRIGQIEDQRNGSNRLCH